MGTFIVFEGPDGSGTTTQSKLLAKKLMEDGLEVVLTQEPTEGEYGKQIRADLNAGGRLSSMELQQLFCADRAEHVGCVILPALRAGKVVISDRYIPSTLIYGKACGISGALLASWNEGFPVPDLVVFTMPPLDVCFKRVGMRKAQDAFEREAFMEKVYEGYVRYASENPGVLVIDTSKKPEENLEEVVARVELPALLE